MTNLDVFGFEIQPVSEEQLAYERATFRLHVAWVIFGTLIAVSISLIATVILLFTIGGVDWGAGWATTK